jgi:hypothetical protein
VSYSALKTGVSYLPMVAMIVVASAAKDRPRQPAAR